MPRMVSEGITLKDDTDVLPSIRAEAKELLERGPAEWSLETKQLKRYFITDVMDDFIGSTIRAEELFCANTLADLLAEFVLRMNRQWMGSSKWTIRALNHFDTTMAKQLVTAFDAFYRKGDKSKVIQLTKEWCQPYGGLIFGGISVGKNK